MKAFVSFEGRWSRRAVAGGLGIGIAVGASIPGLAAEISPVAADVSVPLPLADGGVNAAAARAPGQDYLPWPSVKVPASDSYEIRGGIMDDFILKERGLAANGDFVFRKFWTTESMWDFLIPRVHVGGMGNLEGKTSYAYAGLVWTYNYTERIFGEVSFGGAVHNGYLVNAPPGRNDIGCRFEYDSGASLGMRMTPQWSVMLTLDHVSNGKGTLSSCPANESLNELGLRLGYAF
jgi:lipid A 3-O-deacylase